MNDSRFLVVHVCLATGKPFEEVAEGIERQLGHFDPDVDHSLTVGGDPSTAKARIEARAGTSGFMLFGKRHHGSMLRIVGKARKAVQYVVGNPLFAVQMTQHDIRASLYVPLRVLLYENEEGKTYVEYDKPSLLFGQFGNTDPQSRFGLIDRSHFGVTGQRRPGPLDSVASGRENRIYDWCQVRTTLTWNPDLERIADTPEGAAHRPSNGRWARTPLVTVQADEVIGAVGGTNWRDWPERGGMIVFLFEFSTMIQHAEGLVS
jgi:uncharacterized protein (DUF302 family)